MIYEQSKVLQFLRLLLMCLVLLTLLCIVGLTLQLVGGQWKWILHLGLKDNPDLAQELKDCALAPQESYLFEAHDKIRYIFHEPFLSIQLCFCFCCFLFCMRKTWFLLNTGRCSDIREEGCKETTEKIRNKRFSSSF